MSSCELVLVLKATNKQDKTSLTVLKKRLRIETPTILTIKNINSEQILHKCSIEETFE